MNPQDVDIIETNCARPDWTRRCLASVRRHYPDNRIIVVDDHCVDCRVELQRTIDRFGAEVIWNEERVGCGRALDAGLRAASSRWVLLLDHGITLEKPGAIELLLSKAGEGVAGVGRRGGGASRCTLVLGPYMSWWLGLWDREYILAHDLSFRLGHLRFPDGSRVGGCTTGQFLCYQVEALGGGLAYVTKQLRPLYQHERDRTPFGRRFPSRHEGIEVAEGEIDLEKMRRRAEKLRKREERRRIRRMQRNG